MLLSCDCNSAESYYLPTTCSYPNRSMALGCPDKEEIPASVEYQNIPSGLDGAEITIQEMARDAVIGSLSWEVIETAREIIRNCNPRDNKQIAETIFFWMKKNVPFVRDPTYAEMVQSPERTLKSRMGDCDCRMTALASLNLAVGNEVRFVTIALYEPEYMDHVYLQVRHQNGAWCNYDLVHNPGYEPRDYVNKVAWNIFANDEAMAGFFSSISKAFKKAVGFVEEAGNWIERNTIRKVAHEIRRVTKKNLPFVYKPLSQLSRKIINENRRVQERIAEEFARWERNLPGGKFLTLGVKFSVGVVTGGVIGAVAGPVVGSLTNSTIGTFSNFVIAEQTPIIQKSAFKLSADDWKNLASLGLTIGNAILTIVTAGTASALLASSIIEIINAAKSGYELSQAIEERKKLLKQLKEVRLQVEADAEVQRQAIAKLEDDLVLLERIIARQAEQSAQIKSLQEKYLAEEEKYEAAAREKYDLEIADYRKEREIELAKYIADLKAKFALEAESVKNAVIAREQEAVLQKSATIPSFQVNPIAGVEQVKIAVIEQAKSGGSLAKAFAIAAGVAVVGGGFWYATRPQNQLAGK